MMEIPKIGLIARVAELVDALVLGTSILGCESSSLSPSTIHSSLLCPKRLSPRPTLV